MARTVGQALQGFASAIAFAVGGYFAWYKFIRQGEHDPRLQATVAGDLAVHEGTICVAATATAQNTGKLDLDLVPDDCALEVFTTVAGGPQWTVRHTGDVFLTQGKLKVGITLEDQVWLEIPRQNEIALSLKLTVSYKGKNEEIVSLDTTEIISMIPKHGEKNSSDG